MKENKDAHILEQGKTLISIIVATYRRKESLYDAIQSLINQTYIDIEIIIVDDNADEFWNQQVKSILQIFYADKRIYYIVNEVNKGSAETRNIGIKFAKGKYITFLDDDDIYLPHKIEYQVKYMIEKDADYCITDLSLYRENGRLDEVRTRAYIQKINSEILLEYHLKYHMTGTDTLMFKKEYLTKIGGFDAIDVGDEFYLMLKAIKMAGAFDYLPRCDVKAYIHTDVDGLSSGQIKINGENKLFEYKKSFFNKLNIQNIQYIKMRHYAVLAFAYLRMNEYKNFFMNAGKSFFQSPLACVQLILERIYSCKR